MSIYLWMQKQVLKETLKEINQRAAAQDEFKTIFNMLDESVMIFQNKRIRQLNKMTTHFIRNCFGPEIAYMVSENADIYNNSLNEEQIYGKRKNSFARRCKEKFLGIRENRLSQVLTDQKVLEYSQAEK